ncbi:MAG: pyridoxal phosphate-dependent aminotransferase, partial [Desulfonatronovibrionaceae bacterium]
SLAVGEPDFDTPEYVKRAIKEALDSGYTRYTAVQGLPEVRAAVAGYFNRHYGAQAVPEQVMVSNGGKQCLYNLLQTLIDPGDEVLIPAPYWVSYPDMTVLAGGKPVVVPCSPDRGFELTVSGLKDKLTARTKVLILNSPSNPTGRVHSQEKLEEIFAWAASREIFVISDEIYDRLVYPPAEPVSLSRVWPKAECGLAVVNGLSKSFSTTGLRAGFVLAPQEVIQAMAKLQGQSTSNVCAPVQKGIQAALEGGEEFVDRMRVSLGRRRDKALEKIASWPEAVCHKPEGAFYLFPRLDRCLPDWPGSVHICERVLEETGVALVPGEAFGDDSCVRISYAVQESTLDRALDAVGSIVCK